ncbi:single-stranded DNA-binding protein WHY2, mitochondrial-like [Miscanthus floridulus]|uniref:single-stranded DNA-binding protein WHY2, mitochondrial-like n=1 Tax=Miscanthus floridulus TaxID=154761 RepID=UPI00345930D7
MLRLSRFLPSASRRGFDLKESLWSGSLTFQQAVSTSAANLDENLSGKKYASYTVFKGKAALSIHPILPSFSKLESGGSRVSRNGSVMLTFFPAVGQRKYDYTKKQLFALSPTEVGSLISLGPAESCEFFHDPSMKSSNEGMVKKSLSITPLGCDSGYFVNITVVNSVEKTNDRLSVPVTKAEFSVMRTALSFALPHIMGWDQALTNHHPAPPAISKPRVERPHPGSEWER